MKPLMKKDRSDIAEPHLLLFLRAKGLPLKRRNAQGKCFDLRLHRAVVANKKIFDIAGGCQDKIARLKYFIHKPVTVKGLISFLLKVLGRQEESFGPLDD